MRGLGLLPVYTVFSAKKTRTRVSGVFREIEGCFKELSGRHFSGYEIHMGVTGAASEGETSRMADLEAAEGEMESVKTDGTCTQSVCGTYVHGIFDEEGCALSLIKSLASRRGIDMKDLETMDFAAFKETQYDLLAAKMRKHLDMDAVYRILEEGIGR